MKGIEDLQWALMLILLSLIVIAFAVSPVERLIEARTTNDARLLALDIASSINLLQASPAITLHTIRLPTARCEIEIYDSFVRVRMLGNQESEADADIIDTPLPVENAKLECSRTSLRLSREGNAIRIR